MQDALKLIDVKVLPIFKNCIPLKTDFSLVSQECLVKLKCTGLINGEMTECLSWHIFLMCINQSSLFQSPNRYTLGLCEVLLML